MSYRIQVLPEAGALLRAFAPHVVLRLGRALAELADSLAAGGEDTAEVRVDGCVLRLDVDRDERLLRVVDVEQVPSRPAVYAAADATL